MRGGPGTSSTVRNVVDPGAPDEPEDRPGTPRRRQVHDWDWGGGWESPERASREDASPAEDPASDADRGPEPAPGATTARVDAVGTSTAQAEREDDAETAEAPADEGDGEEDDPRPRRTPQSVVRRRRATVLGAAAAVTVAAIAGVAVLAGGHDDGPGANAAASTHLLADQLQAASTDAVDRLDRAAAVRRYAKLGLPVYCGAGTKPYVALTFDDGPDPTLSPKLITLLAKERAPATLFRIGRNVPGNEEYVRVQRNLGWDAGSHTQSHPFLAKLPAKDQRTEIEGGANASAKVLGRPPELFRPPYESHDRDTDRIAEDLGVVQVLWNVDTQDALGSTTADQIADTAIKGLHPGSIILMHEVKPNTLKALPRILAAIREKGLTPVTVTTMLAEDGPSKAQLQKGYDGCLVDLTPGKAAS